jgi:hypothetical protein
MKLQDIKPLNESTNDKYEEVIFLQDSSASEALDILDSKGEAAALDYLKQWDNGDGGEVLGTNPGGRTDSKFEKDGYLMTYNTKVGYIGLSKVISKHDDEAGG